MTHKPDGYTSVAPYLTVNGAQGTIDFPIGVFGAQFLRMIPWSQGIIAQREARIDEKVIMISDAVAGWPATPSHVHLYFPDVDETFDRAVAAGAFVVKPTVQEGDTDKRGGFKDAEGTTWWVSTQIE